MQQRVERAEWWRDHLRQRCRRPGGSIRGKPYILIAHVASAVGEYYGFPVDLLISKSRKTDVVQARQVGFYLARLITKRSYPEIGRRMGKFDHSTVIHACRRVEADLDENPEVRADVAAIREAILNGW